MTIDTPENDVSIIRRERNGAGKCFWMLWIPLDIATARQYLLEHLPESWRFTDKKLIKWKTVANLKSLDVPNSKHHTQNKLKSNGTLIQIRKDRIDFIKNERQFLQTSTTSTTLSSCSTMRDRSDILNTANLHARTSQCTQSTLCTWTRSLGSSTTSGSQFNVQSVDAQSTTTFGNILSGQHGSVWTGFVTIGLHFHATSNTSNSFSRFGLGMNTKSQYLMFYLNKTTYFPDKSVTWTKVSLKDA